MDTNVIEDIEKKVLFVHHQMHKDSAVARLTDRFTIELKKRGVNVIEAETYEEGSLFIKSDSSINLILLDWHNDDVDETVSATHLISQIEKKNNKVPVFLCADRERISKIDSDTLSKFDDFIWLMEDTPNFISGRIIAAIDKYCSKLLPPMFNALVKFSKQHEYSWHTPGHTGGTGFLKHPVGKFFFDFFGENLLRSDLSISVGQLGSLLDHTGPIGQGEKYAAKVFGSDRTYYVTNGSSTSNRIITMASVTKDQVVMCDRNCHKSIEHALTMAHSIPTYMVPVRNGLGIIGPILPHKFEADNIKAVIEDNPLTAEIEDRTPKHLVLTNSTYDGLCYNIEKLEEILGDDINTLHFDEAWYGYAKFHPMYKGRFAMHDGRKEKGTGPNVFSTHSTHKLLVALSQASLVHVRDGKNPINHARFNESFMLHSSTSPNYAIIASNDVSASMMSGTSGRSLVEESITEAVEFRQMLSRMYSEYSSNNNDWFFKGWQPDNLHKVNTLSLVNDSSHWLLKPKDEWHGFGDVPEAWVMLDPIKVSIMSPGMNSLGDISDWGIPATIVSRYLSSRGIEVEKTTDFAMLFLFSLGITKGKWGTLISELANFKRDYDHNVDLVEALPKLVEDYPGAYENMGLKDLCDKMFNSIKEHETTKWMSAAFSELPNPVMTPAEAYQKLVKNEIEKCDLNTAANRVAATGIVPYPPGIPVLMPGENAGASNGAIISYLRSLESFDKDFPGFEHDTHGVEVEGGKYYMLCLKE